MLVSTTELHRILVSVIHASFEILRETSLNESTLLKINIYIVPNFEWYTPYKQETV